MRGKKISEVKVTRRRVDKPVDTRWICDICSGKNDADAVQCASCTLFHDQANANLLRPEVQPPLPPQRLNIPSGFFFGPTIGAMAGLCGTSIPNFLERIAGSVQLMSCTLINANDLNTQSHMK